jgi:hypothetical protein
LQLLELPPFLDALPKRLQAEGLAELQQRLGISTQCGFASGAEDDRFDERVQAAKLELVAEVAQEIWGAA